MFSRCLLNVGNDISDATVTCIFRDLTLNMGTKFMFIWNHIVLHLKSINYSAVNVDLLMLDKLYSFQYACAVQ
jgi:hypothetical protein